MPIFEIVDIKPIYKVNDKVKIYVKNTTNRPIWYVIQGQFWSTNKWYTGPLDITNKVKDVPQYRLLKPGQSRIWYDQLGHIRPLPKHLHRIMVVTTVRYDLEIWPNPGLSDDDAKYIYSKSFSFKHLTVTIPTQ